MRLTLRRVFQASLLAVLVSFSTLAVVRMAQNSSSGGGGGQLWLLPWSSDAATSHLQVQREQQAVSSGRQVFGPDRAPRSVEESPQQVANLVAQQQMATATPAPHTTLDDIFISVKTTKNFHQSRLDVILKTWFTLARDQVIN